VARKMQERGRKEEKLKWGTESSKKGLMVLLGGTWTATICGDELQVLGGEEAVSRDVEEKVEKEGRRLETAVQPSKTVHKSLLR